MTRWLALLFLAVSGPALAQAPAPATVQPRPSPLFASDAPIRLAIQGPVRKVVNRAERSTSPEAATLVLAGPSESLPIRLAARGLSRRTGDICQFPPLRVEFAAPPAATSLFAGQRRLKLVTHCRSSSGFQQHLLMEYAAYKIFNQLTPLSYRVRLAMVDYAEPDGKVSTSRWGFFIEDLDDVARRNGLVEARVGDRILATQLEPRQAARLALFQYMIGNLDWSMRAGPQGEGCCHNSRLLTGRGVQLIPVSYDFDYSGMVDAPYALPPDQVPVKNVRTRYYMGYCRHNREAMAAAAEFRAKRAAIESTFAQVPDLSEGTKRKALNFLGDFFEDIATEQSMRAQVLKDCIN